MLHGYRQLYFFNIKTEDLYEDIADDVEKRCETWNWNEVTRPLPTGKSKKVIGLMKDESGGKIIT